MEKKKKADRMLGMKALALALVVGAGLSLCFTARKGVESDLFALIDSATKDDGLKSAAAAMATSAHFLVKADSEEAARARLASLGALNANTQTLKRAIILKSLAPFARGFLSPATRDLLERGAFAAVREAAAQRLFSPLPPVLPLSVDPFLLFTDYVLNLSGPKGEWVAVNVELTPEEAASALAAVADADDVRCAGAPFHTAVASERSKREINILSGISLFCVVLFGWLLTRSFRFLPVLLATLAAAFCVATAAVFAVFPRPHLMTFVFGTSLIGLGVDYVYHAWTAARELVAKPLTFSFLSTAACFLPLFFSGVDVLGQMALFTVAGLATAYVGMMAFGKRRGVFEFLSEACLSEACLSEGCLGEERLGNGRTGTICRIAVFVLFAICTAGIFRAHVDNDLSRFHRPDPSLAAGERIAAASFGGEGFIPSVRTQLHDAELVRRLYAAEGKAYCAMTGLPASVLKLPAADRAFDPKGELGGVFARLTHKLRFILKILFGATTFLCLPLLLFPPADWRRGVAVCFLSAMTAALATVGLLGWLGEPITFFNLLCLFIFFGLGLDYSIFTWHARRHRSCGSRSLPSTPSLAGGSLLPTGRAVRYSFLTSFVGFGLLSFTAFAVTRSMGMTLAAGLAFSYLAAKAFCGGERGATVDSADQPAATAWHEQREQCASPFWAQFMWCSYAWFGKTFQKTIFVIGMPVIYLFSRPARVALTRFYGVLSTYTGRSFPATHGRLFRHILGFAWGVMDKTDACTLKKNPPRMDVRDDGGWRAFKGLVDAGKGAFLLCTHVGMIGVLPALPDVLRRRAGGSDCGGGRSMPQVHAFQQMGHDAVFMKMFMKHFDRSRLELHAVEEIGVETAVEMQEAIRRGDLVIMAGDRTSAGSKSVLKHRFLGRDCVWPKGAFKFAELMEAPVFGVTCVRTGWNRYEVHAVELGAEDGGDESRQPRRIDAFLSDYVRFLEAETLAHPEQWYQFYDFFGSSDD